MRREYDFSQGTRGKHAGKRLRIVGDKHSGNGPDTAARIQQTIERDLKSREDFKVIWSQLDPAERESIRAALAQENQYGPGKSTGTIIPPRLVIRRSKPRLPEI